MWNVVNDLKEDQAPTETVRLSQAFVLQTDAKD